jgi:hypothetical protein
MLAKPAFLPFFRLILAAVVAGGLAGSLVIPSARANTPITVNNQLADAPDKTPGNGVCETDTDNGICTLRAAIMEANAMPGMDTVIIPAGAYILSRVATSFEDAALNGDLDITGDLTITGAGSASTIIDGNRTATQARVFQVLSGVTVSISGLTIRNGTNEPGPGITGGILNHGTLTMEHVTITANAHGGLDSRGMVTLNHTTYTDNGLCIYNSGGSLIILNSEVVGNNNPNGNCGGVGSAGGSLTLVNTTLSGNSVNGTGGGLWLAGGIATLINTTISGNIAGNRGGGIFLFQSSAQFPTVLNLYNATIVNNMANSNLSGVDQGGGIHNYTYDGITPTVYARNSLIANNVRRTGLITSTPNDCYGPLSSEGYNLIESTTGCTINGVTTGNKLGLDPKLDPLADNGGSTQTHALKSDSPAINAGNPNGCADGLGALLATDQRGYERHASGNPGAFPRCDIGAFEFGSTVAAPASSQVFLPIVLK